MSNCLEVPCILCGVMLCNTKIFHEIITRPMWQLVFSLLVSINLKQEIDCDFNAFIPFKP